MAILTLDRCIGFAEHANLSTSQRPRDLATRNRHRLRGRPLNRILAKLEAPSDSIAGSSLKIDDMAGDVVGTIQVLDDVVGRPHRQSAR